MAVRPAYGIDGRLRAPESADMIDHTGIGVADVAVRHFTLLD